MAAKLPSVGDLVAPHGQPSEIYRVAERIGTVGVRILPWNRGGAELVLSRYRGVVTDGTRPWRVVGRA